MEFGHCLIDGTQITIIKIEQPVNSLKTHQSLFFLYRNIADARFTAFLIEVIDLTLELYASTIGTCPQTDRLFSDIRKRVDRETKTLRQLMMLKGSLDLVITANQTKKPTLTCEERMLKELLKEEDDPYLFKLLNF